MAGHAGIVVAMPARGHVLVVEEDPLVRLAIDRQLEMLGYDVLTVNTGEEAIRVVELGLPLQYLVISLKLPDLDARDVAAIIAGLAPGVRVVFTGEMTDDETLVLVKPFSTPQLATALARAVRMAGPRRRYPR